MPLELDDKMPELNDDTLLSFFEYTQAEFKVLSDQAAGRKICDEIVNIDCEIEFAFEAPMEIIFPDLSDDDIAYLTQIGTATPWADRSRRDRRDAFEWILDLYGMFIPGLTQAHILQADPGLWAELQGKLTDARQGRAVVPHNFNVPSERDARLLKEADPKKRVALLAKREQERVRKAAQRQRKRLYKPEP